MEINDGKTLPHRRLFFTLSSSLLTLFVIELLWSHGEIGSQALFFRHYDTYMDFFNTIKAVATSDPYGRHLLMYPPLAGLLIKAFSWLIPRSVLFGTAFAIRNTQSGQMAYLAFLLIALFGVALLLSTMFRAQKSEKRFLIFLVLFSLPFLYTYERGNTILYAVLLLMAFIHLKDSPRRWLREAALLALAGAACLKVYPALFGLLLVRERRWMDMLKAILYGLVLFFVPFVFFGGFAKVPALLQTLGMGNVLADDSRFGYKVDLTNLMRIAGAFFRLNDDAVLRVAPWACYGLLALSVPAVVGLRGDWKALMLLGCALIVLPPFNYVYALIYAVIPLVAFLNKENHDRWDWFYATVFALLMTPLYVGNVLGRTGGAIAGYPLTIMNLIQSVLCAGCYLALLVRGYVDLARHRRRPPAAKAV